MYLVDTCNNLLSYWLIHITKTQFLRSKVNFLLLTSKKQWFKLRFRKVPDFMHTFVLNLLGLHLTRFQKSWYFFSLSMTFKSSFTLPPLNIIAYLPSLFDWFITRVNNTISLQSENSMWPIFIVIRINYPSNGTLWLSVGVQFNPHS